MDDHDAEARRMAQQAITAIATHIAKCGERDKHVDEKLTAVAKGISELSGGVSNLTRSVEKSTTALEQHAPAIEKWQQTQQRAIGIKHLLIAIGAALTFGATITTLIGMALK
jgi:hypothetical protein